MWKEKAFIATGRLSRDFGRVVQRFAELGQGREHEESDKHVWHGTTRVEETSPQSEWRITLYGKDTIFTPLRAALHGTKAKHIHEYRVEIMAYLQIDQTIRLVAQGTEEDWDKLEGLWDKLSDELRREGYREAPTVEATVPAVEAGQLTTEQLHPWDVATIPVGKHEVLGFFERGWDFAVPPFTARDGRPLKLDNVVMQSTDLHRRFTADPAGHVVVALNAMGQLPDSGNWDLGSAIPVIQFVLDPLGNRTKVQVVLRERGAGHFLVEVLQR